MQLRPAGRKPIVHVRTQKLKLGERANP